MLPVDDNGSPYASHAARGMSHLFIGRDWLMADGLLAEQRRKSEGVRSPDRVDYHQARKEKDQLVSESYRYFRNMKKSSQLRDFEHFCKSQGDWLDDHALFDALKDAHGGAPWFEWPAEIKERRADALSRWRQKLNKAIQLEKYAQWLAHRQWQRLKSYANANGVLVVGDVPFFVRHDSVDVWVNQQAFWLDRDGQPTVVAGVPPDVYSQVGQRWGNPVYRWEALTGDDYRLLTDRVQYYASLFDILRLDHFRGYAALWHIPAAAADARSGQWVASPGDALLRKIAKIVSADRLIAEDIGYITKDVVELRDRFGLPGTRIIQFGFAGGADDQSLPHMFPDNSVAYTSNHDTHTATGWLAVAPADQREKALAYTGSRAENFSRKLIELGLQSAAKWFITPLQDVLGLGNEARMNKPNTSQGNWQWRFSAGQLTRTLAGRLGQLTNRSDRGSSV